MKKLLALVLALVMTMSLVTISNAAFSDADDIDYTEAVEVMNAVGVIEGMPGGTFAPKGNVTRAQMAKMITIIMLGDVDPAAFVGTTTDLTDISGHWAEGYIKYCYSQGVIAGKGEGKFDPDANVTTVEAAKMLLVAIGYNAEVQAYVGADWAINVIRDAQLSKFFEDLSLTSTKVLTRDEAAQMIYNAITAKSISKNPSINISNGQVTYSYRADGDPLMESTFEAYVEYAYLTDVSYDSTSKKYTYSTETAACGFGAAIDADDALTGGFAVKSTVDYSELFGQKVKVVWKNDKNHTIYGIYSAADILVEDILGNVTTPAATDEKVKIDDVKYNLEDDANTIKVYEFLDNTVIGTLYDIDGYCTSGYTAATGTKCGPQNKAFTGKLIDNDGDGKGDVVVVYPFTVEKVNYIGTKSFTTAAVLSGIGGATQKFEDVTVYDGITKDDYVKVTAANNNAKGEKVFEKLDLVKAKAAAVKVNDGKVKFGDNWFKTSIVGTSNAEAGAESKYVEVNGYLFYLSSNSAKADVSDFVVVTARANNAAGIDNTYTTKLLKSDGTKVTVEATTQGTVGNMYTIDENDDGYTVLAEVNSTSVTTSNSKFDYVKADGTTTAKNGDLTGTSFTVKTGSTKGYMSVSTSKYYINDDAVIFVYDSTGSGKYSVITGAALKATGTAAKVAFLGAVDNDDTGYTNVALAYVNATSAITTDSKAYGYVVDDAVKYEESSNKFYTEVKFWDGEAVVTLDTKTVTGDTGIMAKAYNLKKGDVFTYELNADGKIETMTIYDAVELINGATASGKINIAALIGYADDTVKVSKDYFTAVGTSTGHSASKDLEITDDTVILYVNTADTEGVDGGSIQLASSNVVSGVTSNYANVMLITNSANTEIELLVVDVNNDILDLQ